MPKNPYRTLAIVATASQVSGETRRSRRQARLLAAHHEAGHIVAELRRSGAELWSVGVSVGAWSLGTYHASIAARPRGYRFEVEDPDRIGASLFVGFAAERAFDAALSPALSVGFRADLELFDDIGGDDVGGQQSVDAALAGATEFVSVSRNWRAIELIAGELIGGHTLDNIELEFIDAAADGDANALAALREYRKLR